MIPKGGGDRQFAARSSTVGAVLSQSLKLGSVAKTTFLSLLFFCSVPLNLFSSIPGVVNEKPE